MARGVTDGYTYAEVGSPEDYQWKRPKDAPDVIDEITHDETGFDNLDNVDETASVILPNIKKSKKVDAMKAIDTGQVPNRGNRTKNPPVRLAQGVRLSIAQENTLYYPKKLNEDNPDLPDKTLYLPHEKEKTDLPEGTAVETSYVTITSGITFSKQDWDRVNLIITMERDTIKNFFKRGILKYTDEIILNQRIKKMQITELAKEEAMREIKEKVARDLVAEELLWNPKYKKRDPDADLLWKNREVKPEEWDNWNQEERSKFLERMMKRERKLADLKEKEEKTKKIEDERRAKETPLDNSAQAQEEAQSDIELAPEEVDSNILAPDNGASDAPTLEDLYK
jgi:hypothetical protein